MNKDLKLAICIIYLTIMYFAFCYKKANLAFNALHCLMVKTWHFNGRHEAADLIHPQSRVHHS